MLSLLYNIFFNPYLISFRVWINIFKLFSTLFQIQQNDQVRSAAVLPLVYSVVMSSFTPYSIFLLSRMDDKSDIITDIVYYGSIGFFTSNIVIGNIYYNNIINRNRFGYLFKFINIGMIIYYRQINKFNYIIIGLPFQLPMIIKYYGILDIRYKNENIYKMLYFFYRVVYSIFLLINVIKYKMNDLLIYLIGIFIYFLYNY
jgi:hypothetical protein